MKQFVMKLAAGYYHAGALSKKPALFDTWLFKDKDRKAFYAERKKWWGRCLRRAWCELKNAQGMMANDIAPIKYINIAQINIYSFKALALGVANRTINVPSIERSDVSLTFSDPTSLVEWSKKFIKEFGPDGVLSFANGQKGTVIFNPKFEQWKHNSSIALERSINRFYRNGKILND